MKVITAYRFALEPNRAQESALSSWQGPLRFLWNWMLQQRRDTYIGSEGRVRVSYEDQANQLPAMKKQFPFLAEVPANALQHCLKDLDRAFVNFFEKRGAYPRWKSKAKGSTPCIKNPDAKQFRIVGKRIFLPKLKWVKFRASRPVVGALKNATVTHDGLRWFVSVQTEREVNDPAPRTDAPLGLDAGVAHSLADSAGRLYALPVATEDEAKRLAKLARAVSRKQKGSKRRAKAMRRALVARRHILNRVNDARHKFTTNLAKNHGVIVVEDLALKAMTASAKGTPEAPGTGVKAKSGLNRTLLAQGHFETFRQLEYKLGWTGGSLIRVNPAFTSQRCSCCGHVATENRKSRDDFRCVKCGYAEHADINAAKNILRAGTPANNAAGHAVSARGATPKATRRNANPKTRPAHAA
jgi:putative transposase